MSLTTRSVKEVCAALAVLAIYLLTLLVPLHQAAASQKSFADNQTQWRLSMLYPHARAALAAAIIATLPLPAFAHDHSSGPHSAHVVQVGDLEISGAFTRATLPGAPVGGGYLVVTNHGDTDDRLVGGAAPFANDVQVHEMAVVDDVMQMRELQDGIVIPAGESVELKPGGYHLMFMALTTALVEGETVTVSLKFETAGTVDVEFAVEATGARGASGHQHSGH